MNLTISSPGIVVNEYLRYWIEERIASALGRFHANVHDVLVLVTEVNGHRGRNDKHCRIIVSLWTGTLTTEGDGESIMAAVDLASRRVRRVVKNIGFFDMFFPWSELGSRNAQQVEDAAYGVKLRTLGWT